MAIFVVQYYIYYIHQITKTLNSIFVYILTYKCTQHTHIPITMLCCVVACIAWVSSLAAVCMVIVSNLYVNSFQYFVYIFPRNPKRIRRSR